MLIRADSSILDYSSVIRSAIAAAKEGETIEFEKGVYRISDAGAERMYYALSNNDASEKAIAFHIRGKKGIRLVGNGATLLFTCPMSGFGIAGSKDIEISGFTVDYDFNYHLELEILEADAERGRVKVAPREGFPFRLENGEIAAEFGTVGKTLCTEYDPKTGSIRFGQAFAFVDFSCGRSGEFCTITARPVQEESGLYLYTEMAKCWQKGSVLVLCYVRRRYHHAVFIDASENVRIRDLTVAYCPAMAVTAQLSSDIFLENVRVERNGRHGFVSAVCDATHFVHCRGEVRMRGCSFFNMNDDAVNIHGNYLTVTEKDANGFSAQIMHYQQRGVNILLPGDRVLLYRQKTVEPVAEVTIEQSEMPDPARICVRCSGDLSGVNEGDTVYNISRCPEVTIEDTSSGNNRPRGFLLNSSRKTVVRGCTFRNSEQGIELVGDTNYWYESGGCDGVLIENNLFENCNHAAGEYPVRIAPIFAPTEKAPYYHRDVTVRGNLFRGFRNGMVFAQYVDGLTVEDNRFERSGAYPAAPDLYNKIMVRDCKIDAVRRNVDFEEIRRELCPIWMGREVLDQTAVCVGEEDEIPLLYIPQGKVRVTDYAGERVFEEGKDYAVCGRKVKRLAGGGMPFYTREEFYRTQPDRINVPVDGRKLPGFDGPRYFKFGDLDLRTVRLSYSCEKKTDVFSQGGIGACCPKFRKLLRERKPCRILFYGDSITEGANASAETQILPFREMWPYLVTVFLREFYGDVHLDYVNTAVGGKESVWGLENFDERVLAYAPDLLVLAFGMNDGNKPAEEFGRLTEQMVKRFAAALPQSELMLVATSVPNPESAWYGTQASFLPALQRIGEKYALPVADMTTVTEKLYGAGGCIRYRDFSANNVNHPNDFGVRLYAQVVLNRLLGEEYRRYYEKEEQK